MGPTLFCGPTFIFPGCAHPNPGVMKNMESIWSKTARIREHPPLQGDLNVQVAVLGGGMAGILTAYRLREQGADVAVLEASRVGSGQTKGTTAKITSQHDLIYARMIRELGAEKARQYADANQTAIGEYRRLIERLGIACQFEQRPAYLYSTLAEDAAALREEARAARELGIDGAFTETTELPFPVAGAVRFDGQAQFHPFAFLSAVSAGLRIFEHTAAVTVDGNRISTDRGSVTAEKIVFATHFPFLNKPGYYFARMHQERSYVLALEHVTTLHGMYLGIGESGLSFRSWGDTLLLGGGGHRTGENRTGGSYDLLRRAAAEFFPGGTEVAHWSAQDCMPLDGVPYIGRYSASAPDWYVATGFGKWGMTSSMAASMVLTDLITGQANPWAEVFSPERFTPAASVKNLLKEGAHAVAGLSREFLAPPRAEIDALPQGHGGIVEYDGKKIGVYKDDLGQAFLVSTRCPHLGCQLEWNPDEKSWDCPCHGSRFDYRGNLIDNPAQSDLAGAEHA